MDLGAEDAADSVEMIVVGSGAALEAALVVIAMIEGEDLAAAAATEVTAVTEMAASTIGEVVIGEVETEEDMVEDFVEAMVVARLVHLFPAHLGVQESDILMTVIEDMEDHLEGHHLLALEVFPTKTAIDFDMMIVDLLAVGDMTETGRGAGRQRGGDIKSIDTVQYECPCGSKSTTIRYARDYITTMILEMLFYSSDN